MELSFGEQVKVLLKRRGMTIKELAGQIETATGMKMSRQNLTQRLLRDNFQEQDMRMIASVLGCTLELNLIDPAEEPAQTEPAVESDETLRESGMPDSGTGQVAAQMPGPAPGPEPVPEPEPAPEPVSVPEPDPEPEPEPTPEELEKARLREIVRRAVFESRTDALSFVSDTPRKERPAPKTAADIDYYDEDLADIYGTPVVVPQAFKKSAAPETAADPDVNPRTGEEYESNVVRSHPKLKGYIQVYDRGEHKWIDMTEWAFLGFQERKKKMLGVEYKPPIYLD